MFPVKDDVLYNSYEDERMEAYLTKKGETIIVFNKLIPHENLQKLSAILKALCE
jgi:hypothetical protein